MRVSRLLREIKAKPRGTHRVYMSFTQPNFVDYSALGRIVNNIKVTRQL
jgi:hypothetical protein